MSLSYSSCHADLLGTENFCMNLFSKKKMKIKSVRK